MSKLREKMETAQFLRTLAEAIRRYRGPADNPVASLDRPAQAPRPQDDPDRLASRLDRLRRR